ncbi:uncharacterized protein [Lepisosteus oculatus]|uniref:uncharacterized protein isoform X2 n=1 Tax=Lepisosteus oculatus TaxID=7918 RepID=UPI0035F507BC
MASCLSRLQTELQSFMQLLLKSIVYEVAGVFGNRTSDSEDEVQDQLRNIAQILVRRAVFKITQCVEETFGSEMAQMKKENETLKVRLRFWEKESRAGGDRGQTDRDGHTLPCEVTAEIKEETDTEPELSGSEASALPDAGDRAPLEQQPSEEEEEEWGSRLMQETELAAAHGKETLETTLSEQTGGGDPDSGRHPRRGAALEHIQGHPVLAGILDPEEFDTRSAGSRSLSAVSLQEQTGYYRLKRRKVELGIELLETQLDASVDIAPR